MRRITVISILLSIFTVVSAASAAPTLELEGSTTVGPIADAFKETFERMYPGLEVPVTPNGSGNGATALIEGRCDIAMMSRFMKPKEFENAIERGVYPVAHVIAMDGVCVVVHPSNPMQELTTKQIRDIYKGEITNWNQVGGADMKIVPISRDTASGTYETFHNLVMEKQKMAGHVEYVSTNPQAQARAKTTQGAIAYVGLAFLEGVKAVNVDGVKPSRKAIASGEYPIARPLYLFTNGYPKLGSMAHKFCTFYLTEVGQQIIEKKNFIPLTNY